MDVLFFACCEVSVPFANEPGVCVCVCARVVDAVGSLSRSRSLAAGAAGGLSAVGRPRSSAPAAMSRKAMVAAAAGATSAARVLHEQPELRRLPEELAAEWEGKLEAVIR